MAAHPTLYRLNGIADLDTPSDLEALGRGLRHHLAHDAITSIVVRIGVAQRAYVALTGCPGCATGRCERGCRVQLLGRTLRAAFGEAASLTLIRRGLEPSGYQHSLWAWPLPGAVPFAGELLAGWPRARVVLTWHPGTKRLPLSALITLGGADTDAGLALAPRLRAQGWSCWAVPPPLHRLLLTHPLSPLARLRRGAWSGAPWLLRSLATPAPAVLASPEGDGAAPDSPEVRGAGSLAAVVRAIIPREDDHRMRVIPSAATAPEREVA